MTHLGGNTLRSIKITKKEKGALFDWTNNTVQYIFTPHNLLLDVSVIDDMCTYRIRKEHFFYQ